MFDTLTDAEAIEQGYFTAEELEEWNDWAEASEYEPESEDLD